jgi:hypothetical protein
VRNRPDRSPEATSLCCAVLGTDTKVATINAALHSFALRKQAAEITAAFDSVSMDYAGSESAWRYGGGRDLDRLAESPRSRSILMAATAYLADTSVYLLQGRHPQGVPRQRPRPGATRSCGARCTGSAGST